MAHDEPLAAYDSTLEAERTITNPSAVSRMVLPSTR
jgi:hypothetical protein